jgi:hypothetical protein
MLARMAVYFVYKQEALDYIKILETADKELDKT